MFKLTIELVTCLDHALGEPIGGLTVLWSIEQGERLQRCVGERAASGTGLTINRVKGGHHRWCHGALPEVIHAAPVTIFIGVWIKLRGCPTAVGIKADLLPQTVWLGWEGARPTHPRVEQATNGERVVTNVLSGQTESRSTSQQAVVGVLLLKICGGA